MRIILNADDFGSSPDTLAATTSSFEDGLLTSATVMVGMPATDAALAFARSHPEFSYGVHLLFSGKGEERPLTEARLVRDLVDDEGMLLPANVLRLRALCGRLSVGQIERELSAQVDFVRAAGVPVTHVDSHHHLHKFPAFTRALRAALPRLGLSRVRNVQNLFLRRPVEHPAYWAGPIFRRAVAGSFTTTDFFYMPTTAHDVPWERLAGRLPSGGTLEVGLHPGSSEPWRQVERQSLRPFVEEIRARGHDLIGWSSIGPLS